MSRERKLAPLPAKTVKLKRVKTKKITEEVDENSIPFLHTKTKNLDSKKKSKEKSPDRDTDEDEEDEGFVNPEIFDLSEVQ